MMRCLVCEYDLHGLREPRCPEYGAAFDPNDETTFRTGRESWPIARVARLYAAVLALVPWLAITLAYGTWAAARLKLGFWPQPYQPKAKHVGGIGDAMYVATMMTIMYALPAIATAVCAAMIAVAASMWTRETIGRSFVLLVLCLATGIAFIALLWWDPHRVFDWIFD